VFDMGLLCVGFGLCWVCFGFASCVVVLPLGRVGVTLGVIWAGLGLLRLGFRLLWVGFGLVSACLG
jgi:hypothetical protein